MPRYIRALGKIEAIELVESLLDACVDYERAESLQVKKARKHYFEKKQSVLNALTGEGPNVSDSHAG